MPEPRPRKLPVVLRAAITLDGKLDGAPPEIIEGTQAVPLDAGQLRALLVSGRLDEIHLTIRPRVDGRRDAPTLSGPPTPEFFPRSLACRLLRMETRDGECLLYYRVQHRPRKVPRSG